MQYWASLFTRIRYVLTVLLFNAGSVFLLWNILNPGRFAPAPPPMLAQTAPAIDPTPIVKPVISGKPIRLYIDRLGLELPIEDGLYDEVNDTWTVTDHAAHYASPTPLINDHAGNTLIYGHNIPAVFARLKELMPGDTVTIYTDNYRIFTYALETTYDVLPQNTQIFAYSGKPLLTLQTCTGTWNEMRKMAQFTLVDAL